MTFSHQYLVLFGPKAHVSSCVALWAMIIDQFLANDKELKQWEHQRLKAYNWMWWFYMDTHHVFWGFVANLWQHFFFIWNLIHNNAAFCPFVDVVTEDLVPKAWIGTQQVVPSETSHTHLLLKGDRLKRLSVVRFHVICVVLRHVQRNQREFNVVRKTDWWIHFRVGRAHGSVQKVA